MTQQTTTEPLTQLVAEARQFTPPQLAVARDAAAQASRTGDMAALLETLLALLAENHPNA